MFFWVLIYFGNYFCMRGKISSGEGAIASPGHLVVPPLSILSMYFSTCYSFQFSYSFWFQILAEIFKFLSLRERRNASLVCNKWYQAASFPTYSLNEKLVFRGYQNVDILLSFLSHTKREFLNLEFHGCEFNIDNPSNLLSLTEKIHSLNFMDCTLSVPFASQLLSQCHYLNEFHIGGKFKIIKDSNFIRELVESLFKKQFVNENLKVLHMNVNTSNLTDDKKELLLNMFPNIKNPKFQEITCSHFYIDYVSCISSLLERIILMKDTLETLKIFCCEQRMQLLVPHNFTRLFNIYTTIIFNSMFPILITLRSFADWRKFFYM